MVDGSATSGTIHNFKGVIRNHNEGADDKADAWGLNAKYKLDRWTLAADVGQSKVKKSGSRYETTAGLAGNGNTAPGAVAAAYSEDQRYTVCTTL